MTQYNGSLVLGFQDGSTRQWNGVDNKFIQIHDSNWDTSNNQKSAVAQILNWNHTQIIAFANGAVEQWNGADWKELRGSVILAIDDLYAGTVYQPVNAAQLCLFNDQFVESISADYSFRDTYVVSGSAGQIDAWSSNGWSTIKSLNGGTNNNPDPIEYTIKKILFDPLTKILYAGYGEGLVQSTDGKSVNQIHDNSWGSQVSQMQMYNSTLIVGLTNSAVEQWNGSGWNELHNASWGAPVNQIAIYNDNLILGLNNGAVEQWDGNGWYELHNSGWEAPVTQITLYGGKLIVGLGRYGAIEQWDGRAWIELHGNSWGSPVNQLVNNGTLTVGLADGSIKQWDGSQWFDLQDSPGPGSPAITQMVVLSQ